MTVYQSDLVTELQQRLGDTSATIWTGSEIKDYIQEGYDELTRRTGCLWATDVFPDYAFAFTHTAEFETDYIEAGGEVAGCAQFTSAFERDYVNNAVGPANHNHHWEYNDDLVSETEVSPIVELPEELYEIERATWNTRRVDALRSRHLENIETRYEFTKGEVNGYTQDKDGLRRLRKWNVPSAAYSPYAVDRFETRGFDHTQEWEEDYATTVSGVAQFTSAADAPFTSSTDTGPLNHNYLWEVTDGFVPAGSSYDWGILVDISDVTDATPVDTWGDFVQVPGEHAFGEEWGVIVGVYTEPFNLRVEYSRRGTVLSETEPFDIADRYTVYVRHYAQARCLQREGDGQDVELAAHFMARYESGIERLLKRKRAITFQRKYVMGGAPKTSHRPKWTLPYNYGRVVR